MKARVKSVTRDTETRLRIKLIEVKKETKTNYKFTCHSIF
jgi:hypothetical protein